MARVHFSHRLVMRNLSFCFKFIYVLNYLESLSLPTKIVYFNTSTTEFAVRAHHFASMLILPPKTMDLLPRPYVFAKAVGY